MKKIISIILVFLMLFSSAVTFAETLSDKVLFDLTGLGIISKDQSQEETVTRGEFAEMVVALLGMTELAEQMAPTATFTDVAPNASYAKSVALLSQIGIVNGVSERRFAPNEPVYFEQAVKVIIVCAGYEELAKLAGGWPTGYTAIAAKNGFLSDVTAGNPLSRTALYQLVYNALDIKLLAQKVGSPEIKLEKSSDTLRSLLMEGGSENIYKMTGTVTANAFSYTGSPVANLRENEVVIDSVIYEIGDTDAYDLLGHKVEFYAAEKEDDNGYVLLYIKKAKNDNVIKVDAKNILTKTENKVTYFDENDREESFNITNETKIIYNGTRIKYPTDELFDFTNGTVSFFDNDDDGKAEAVMIEEYVNTIASSFNGQMFQLRNNCTYNGSNSLFVDTDDDYVKMRVIDSEGNPVESFDKEHTISIYADQSGTRYKVMVSDETVTGVVQMISDDVLTVDGEEYNIDASSELDVKVGQLYVMYLNFKDEIVFAESKHVSTFAYLMGVKSEGTFAGYEGRLLLAGAVDFGIDVNEEDVNDTSQIPFLISQNGGVAVYKFAKKVRLDGRNYSGSALATALGTMVTNPVSYTLNEEGEIVALDSLEVCGGSRANRSQYNVYEMLFGGSSLVDGFGITNETQVICVPNSDTAGVADPFAGDEDCMVTVKIDVDNNETGYLVSGYDYNEDKKSARLLVIYADMDAARVRSLDLTSSKASIVSSVVEQYDTELGETKTVVNVLNGSSKLALQPMDLNADNRVLASIKAGDLITYLTNSNGLLENVMIIRSLVGLKNDLNVSNYDKNYTETFGMVTQLVRDEIDTANNVRVTEMTMTVNGASYGFYVPQRNKPPVYIYHSGKGTVESAVLTDIIPGQERVYVLQRTDTSAIRAIVLVR